MSITTKLYNKPLLHRIRDKLDAIKHAFKHAFVQGKNTLFVDFKKAFESIDCSVIFRILRPFGVPDPMTNTVRILYQSMCSAVINDGMIVERVR